MGKPVSSPSKADRRTAALVLKSGPGQNHARGITQPAARVETSLPKPKAKIARRVRLALTRQSHNKGGKSVTRLTQYQVRYVVNDEAQDDVPFLKTGGPPSHADIQEEATMRSTLSLAGANCAVVVCLSATPATADKWPADGASPGGVVWTKVIGQKCPGVLTASEMVELDAYLAKAGSEWVGDPVLAGMSFDRFVTELSARYADDYPQRCGEDAEGARDMLQRVRAVMPTGRRSWARGDPRMWRAAGTPFKPDKRRGLRGR